MDRIKELYRMLLNDMTQTSIPSENTLRNMVDDRGYDLEFLKSQIGREGTPLGLSLINEAKDMDLSLPSNKEVGNLIEIGDVFSKLPREDGLNKLYEDIKYTLHTPSGKNLIIN